MIAAIRVYSYELHCAAKPTHIKFPIRALAIHILHTSVFVASSAMFCHGRIKTLENASNDDALYTNAAIVSGLNPNVYPP